MVATISVVASLSTGMPMLSHIRQGCKACIANGVEEESITSKAGNPVGIFPTTQLLRAHADEIERKLAELFEQ